MVIICWDYDGTLVGSELIYKKVFKKYLSTKKALIRDIEDEYFLKYSGRHPLTLLGDLKRDGYIYDDTALSMDVWNELFTEELKRNPNLTLSENILEVLESLSGYSNVFMAISTSTNKEDYETKSGSASVAGLKRYFEIGKNVYIAGDVGTRELKPAPNVFLYSYKDVILRNGLSGDGNVFVMIEDSESGCESACRAKDILKREYENLDVVVISYLVMNKYSVKSKFEKMGADFVIYDSEDLKDKLIDIIENNKY